jgi:predicted esterase
MPAHPPLTLVRRPAGPHAGQRVLTAGAPLDTARAVVVAVHGRGGRAADMLTLGPAMNVPDVAFCAPQAAEGTWYPARFLAPFEENEPSLSSALDLIAAVVETLEARGIPRRHVVLLGFSQGGCLALHAGATRATRWGGLVGLSAGLIGPPGVTWSFPASLEGTPVFLGCSDRDPHIPEERLRESARALDAIGGMVSLQLYPGLGHAVNADELEQVRLLLQSARAAKRR